MFLRHRSHRLAAALAAGTVAAALAAPPAPARIDPPPNPGYNVLEAAPESADASRPVVRVVDDGFDWGAAAIGAGGAGAVIALASLAAFAGTSRTRPRALR
jgi:hypothetical protein